MKTIINSTSRYFKHPGLGLLIVRVATGLVFFMHGWSKVQNIAGVEGMMIHFGFMAGVGTFIAWLEVVGGLALIFGVAARFFGVVFGIQMAVAIFLTGFSRGYQPHELELLLMFLSFAIALAGAGRFSFLAMDCRECGAMVCRTHK